MRITNQMLIDTVLRNLQRNAEQLLTLQEDVSAGKRVNRPSDDPTATESEVRFRAELEEMEQRLRSVDAANAWVGTTDTSLEQAGDILQRVRELVLQASNSHLSVTDRQAIGVEVSQLGKSLQEVANTRLAGRYIFAGFKTDVRPYAGTTTYDGDAGAVDVNVDGGVAVTVNIPGDQAFRQAFQDLGAIAIQLAAGQIPTRDPAIPTDRAPIDKLDTLIDLNSTIRAETGSRMNRLEMIKTRLEDRRVRVERLRSDATDLDMAEGIVRLSTAQGVYQAALSVAGRTIQPTLLDFLR